MEYPEIPESDFGDTIQCSGTKPECRAIIRKEVAHMASGLLFCIRCWNALPICCQCKDAIGRKPIEVVSHETGAVRKFCSQGCADFFYGGRV